MKHIKSFKLYEKEYYENVDSFFRGEPNIYLIDKWKDEGIMSIENDDLSVEGLINKLMVWDEEEHGVQKFIYIGIKSELESLLNRELTKQEIDRMVGNEIRIIN